MKLDIDPEWFLRMAELEDGRIISVGGFFTRVEEDQLEKDSEESAENAA